MRYGLIGETLKHSHSPRLHAMLGDPEYALMPLPREALDALLTERAFDGLNVTIPYKRDVLAWCAELGETAKRIGSVNTLVKRADGSLYGDNTDAFGFARMAERAGIRFASRKTLVLGSGGTSLTACDVITQAGGQAIVISRHGKNHYEGLEQHADAEVIVNATPVGMYPHVEGAPVDLRDFPRLAGVLDVVYNPLRTRLLQQAEELNIPHAGGLSMLVWQAVRARELFDGHPVAEATALAAEITLRREVSHLVLIGMPGSGKTVIGRRCAQALERPFVDTDAEIVRRAGKSIPEIFAEEGEAAFRALEAQIIAELGKTSGSVISTGGGAVLHPENRRNLRMNGVVVQLARPVEKLRTDGRPLSKGPEELRRMERDRAPFYLQAADRTVQNNRTVAECVRKVLEEYDEALRD